MRRSRSIRLVLLGSVGLIGLAGCDQADPLSKSDFFTDQTECAKSRDADSCRQALADARAKHHQTAPAFTTREECEAQFGAENCQETKEKPGQAESTSSSTTRSTSTHSSSGGSWFMPAMMGYMMGRGMGGSSAQPVYRDTRNTAYSGGSRVGQIDSRLSPPPRPSGNIAGVPAARGGTATSTTSRGGFGGSSASHSSGSSSS